MTARFIAHLRALSALLLIVLGAQVRAADTVDVRLIAINDFHGHLEAGSNALAVPDPDGEPARTVALRVGGIEYLATLVRRLRSEMPHSLFVSAGDLVGASPLISGLFHDEPTIEAMNLLGLALNAAGNHEFDHGVAELRRLIHGGCIATPRGIAQSCRAPRRERFDGARFAMLAANVADMQGRALLPATKVFEFDGVRLGFIGAVTRSTPGIVMPAGIRGWNFFDEAEKINEAARRLRDAGVQALVLVIHEGGSANGGFDQCEQPQGPVFDIAARLDPQISVVFSGHTHRAYNCRYGDRVVIQGGSYGRLVSVVDLRIDRASGRVRTEQSRARNLPVPNGLDGDLRLAQRYPPLPPDDEIARLLGHYRKLAAPLAHQTVGRIAAPFDRRPLDGGDHLAGRLIADAQLAATRSLHGAQVALTNPGGVRTDLIAQATDGRVTYADLFAMQPFGNALVTMTLTGAQLHQILESQWTRSVGDRPRLLLPSHSMRYAYDDTRAPGDRIDPASLRIDGKPIELHQSYRVTVNSYLAEGGDGFSGFRAGTHRVGGPLDVDALADFLQQRSRAEPVQPDLQPRIARKARQR